LEEASRILPDCPVLFKHPVNGRHGWIVRRNPQPTELRHFFRHSTTGKSTYISKPKIQICFQKISEGLDQAHPFSDSYGVDIILREADDILSANLEMVGPKNASRIWGFLSKFVMVDRFSSVLGAAEFHPGLPVPRKTCSPDYIGTGAKVRSFPQ
jgi:hypothetical protein